MIQWTNPIGEAESKITLVFCLLAEFHKQMPPLHEQLKQREQFWLCDNIATRPL
jgi:hypothetical protein